MDRSESFTTIEHLQPTKDEQKKKLDSMLEKTLF